MPDFINDQIDMLKAFAAVKGISQTELAKQLGISQGLVSRILQRKYKPSSDVEIKINNLIK